MFRLKKHTEMLAELSNFLGNYFLDPLGLLALAALIPLIIFYLVRPKPDEKLMPSIRFFMKDSTEGKVQQAISKILQNLMLIFHILLVAALAAAIANPYIEAPETAENTVVILDNSASMKDQLDEAKNFAKDNLGKENTIIVANNDVDVKIRQASKSEARSTIEEAEAEDTSTDLASALQNAKNFNGDIVVASDLDHSIDTRNIESILEEISADRNLKLMEASTDNSWGIVGMDAKEEWIEVKNFKDRKQDITVDLEDSSREVGLGPREVKKINLDLEKGKNTVEISDDGMNVDNKAFFYLPEDNRLDTALISGEKNRYLFKAFELINSTEPSFHSTPLETVPDSDVYIIGSYDNLLSQTVNDVERKVEDEGATAVVYSSESLQPDYFDALPINNITEERTVNVEFNEPRKVNLGETKVFNADIEGESLSTPEEALVHTELGNGDVIFYNVEDEDFRTDFLYPVFWRDLIEEYADMESAKDLNVKTGEYAGDSSKKLETAGFHNVSGQIYSANLLNEDESSPSQSMDLENSGGEATAPKSIQNLSAVLILLLALAELGYLWYIGDLK